MQGWSGRDRDDWEVDRGALHGLARMEVLLRERENSE